MNRPTTREASLPAGDELDAAVQRAVFGLTLTIPPPPYSTVLSAAWVVVEELRRKSDGHFTLLAFTTEWRAGWLTPDPDDSLPRSPQPIYSAGYRRFVAGER